ncbi:hypothetical protein ACKVMT_13425 [Halobacteriales archaeon Cl-PHB]
MSHATADPKRESEPGSRVQCGACGERLYSTAIRYTDLGYAICPSCNHQHGP